MYREFWAKSDLIINMHLALDTPQQFHPLLAKSVGILAMPLSSSRWNLWVIFKHVLTLAQFFYKAWIFYTITMFNN